jgi:CheY-specific phosphatase CheX
VREVDELVNGFIEGTKKTFEISLGYKKIKVKEVSDTLPDELFGAWLSISSKGSDLGIILFSDPMGCQKISEDFLKHQTSNKSLLPELDVADAMGELLNMIGGVFVQNRDKQGEKYSLGFPVFLDGQLSGIRPHRPTILRFEGIGKTKTHLAVFTVESEGA